MKVAVAIVAIVAVGLAGYAIWKMDSGVESPDHAGIIVADAKAKLLAGDKASKGSSVTIWVSQGAEKVAVPDVAGTTGAKPTRRCRTSTSAPVPWPARPV